jgi:hypothetical protein
MAPATTQTITATMMTEPISSNRVARRFSRCSWS